jgi:hypothetical protein
MKPWHRHFNRGLWIAAICACLPVFYILSLGPAVLIYDKLHLQSGGQLGGVLQTFYSPLVNYIENNRQRVEVKLMEAYIALWRGD